jgi:hypothetical protein
MTIIIAEYVMPAVSMTKDGGHLLSTMRDMRKVKTIAAA